MPRLLSLALAVALALLAGCTRREAPGAAKSTSSSPSATPGKKILFYGNGSEPQDLDPQTITGVPEHHLLLAFFEGLIAEDPQLNLKPGVAERWEVSDDGLVYTFHLRANAKWSNGEPVTARDFVASYQRILTPSLASEYSYMLWHVVGAEDYNKGKLTDFSRTGFKALDDRTLQLTLRQRTPFLLHAICFYPWYAVPVSVIKKFGGLDKKATNWTRPENFVGNGAFILKEWRPNQILIAAKSPTYWDRDNVKLDEIHFFPVELADTEERMFRTGQLHIVNEVPLSKIPVYQRENPASIRIDPWLGVYFFRLNVKRKPFDDARVRRALAMTIDRETITQHVLKGGERPAYNLVPPGMPGYVSRHQIKPDLAEAKRLLAEAGYPEGRGMPKIELLYNTLEKHRVIAEALDQMWRRSLGVGITIVNQEWKVYMDATHQKNYDISRGGWIADYVDPHVFLDVWMTDGGNNDTNWGNPEYDRLLRSSLDAKTDPERFEIYQQMEKILVDEVPAIPLFFYTYPRLISPKVKHYYTTLLDNFPWKYVDMEP